MIKISNIEFLEDEFINDIKEKYKEFLEDHKSVIGYSFVYEYCSKTDGTIDDERIKDIIVGDYNKLREIINYVESKYKGIDNKKYKTDGFYELYNNFTNRKFGKLWASKIGIDTCPYCNRSYIYTIDDEKVVRPTYDHFFPKSLYPYLCVSMYNLIPSCYTCNNTKSNYDTYNNDFIYPFIDEYGYNVIFKAYPSNDSTIVNLEALNEDLELKIENLDNTPLSNKINNCNNQLKILDFYNMHIDYVKELRKKCLIYKKIYNKSLINSFTWLKDSNEFNEIYFSLKFKKEEWHKRILSKLTYDMVSQFLPDV